MDEFLKTYQKISSLNENCSIAERADQQRKCTALMYNASLKTLDNQSVCHLLEKNLNAYYHIPDKNKNINDKVKNILRNRGIDSKVQLKSNLENTDLKSILTPFPCSGNLICSNSEAVSSSEFIAFKKTFEKNKTEEKVESNTRSEPNTKFNKNLGRFNSDEGPGKVTKNQKAHTSTFVRVNSEASSSSNSNNPFKTAREELTAQNLKKYGNSSVSTMNFGAVAQRKRLGIRRNFASKFVPPLLSNMETNNQMSKQEECPVEVDERLKNINPEMVELIKNEIMDIGATVTWNDIAGLEFAKKSIQEAVVWPMLRPDIFTGLRRPPKGILLFGPPGTGKTLIGRCVASQSKSTFFSISASSLTSKWVGNGEKMVRALFAVARCHQPAVIFIDEIDSLLSQRTENEHESSRRIKTEFLVQLDGATTDNEERLLLIGATNRPQELDEAARRRFVKRLYIPLPEIDARLQLVTRLVKNEKHDISEAGFKEIANMSEGYSGADIRNLCSEASLEPIRSIDMTQIESIEADDVRALTIQDFYKAFTRVRSSVSSKDLDQYISWDKTYGSGL